MRPRLLHRTADFAHWQQYMASRAASVQSPMLARYFAAGLPLASAAISEVSLVALDIETTGLDPRRDAIVSIGLVPFDSRRVYLARRRYWIVRPSCALTGRSVTLHHITDTDIAHAPDFLTVLPDLLDAMAGHVPVVHYRMIERLFLDAAVTHGLQETFRFPTIDTMEIEARHYRSSLWARWKDWLGYPRVSIRLNDSRARYRLPQYQPHHALVDALATAELFQAQIATHYRCDTPVGSLCG